jgi:UDP:flavonoid glycosyltransferase YjiC (YdhE family)
VSEITLLTWDGGGNVAVTLAIAAAIQEQGHKATVAGPQSIRSFVEPLAVGFTELGIPPPRDPQQRLDYLSTVAQGTDAMLEELHRLAEHTDGLVIDCNLGWALQSRMAGRTAVLVHTALALYLPVWQTVLDTANAQRSVQGLPQLPTAVEAWAWPDLLLVASPAHFDRSLPTRRLTPVYVGAISAPRPRDSCRPAIPAADGSPRILVSYSTDFLQNSPKRLQTALDALAELPVKVLATTSGTFDRDRLRIPTNATVVDYVAHDTAVPTAALVLCHAGHGTTMAALTHGVPVVCVPGLGRDQGPIAERVSELGLGIALPSDATGPMIRHAAATVLADERYLERARRFALRASPADGVELAAAKVLGMLDAR